MKINLRDVSERDMDMLIIEEFLCNEAFRYLFYDQEMIKLDHNFAVCEAYRSLSDAEYGESDITFILTDGKVRVAILIENKIDAPTMEQQSERYAIRAEKGKADDRYDEYFIFLACPQKYWEEHEKDENAQYKHKVFYEDIQQLYAERSDTRSDYKYQVIQTAIEAKKKGYQVIENEAITNFWKELRPYCDIHHPELILYGNNTVKGSGSYWVEFQTSLKKAKIAYKSNKGYVDLQIFDYGDKIGTLRNILEDKGINLDGQGMTICQAHKSAAIRIRKSKWAISFERPFYEVEDIIEDVLNAVDRLRKLAEQLNYDDLY